MNRQPEVMQDDDTSWMDNPVITFVLGIGLAGVPCLLILIFLLVTATCG